MERLSSLQYLRAIAAMGVVVFHALELSDHRFHVGAAGVDIFFVVSGFIMTTLMLGPEASPGLFMRRRLARIVPLYWAATLLAVAIWLVRPAFNSQLDPSFENTILSLLFIPHVSHTGGNAPTLGQGWTLEYEMFFYLLCSALLLLPATNRLKFLAGVLVALSLIGLLFTPPGAILAVYTNPRLLEFGAGIAIAASWKSGWRAPAGQAAAALVVGFAWFAAWQMRLLPHLGPVAFEWGIPAALIVFGALHLEGGGYVPTWRLGVLLGDASFVIYVMHTFVLSAQYWFFASAPDAVRVVGCVVGSAILAVGVHLWFEKPLNRVFRGRSTPARPTAVSAAGS